MAVFRVKVRFEQVVELDVQASSSKAAEAKAEDMVRNNQVSTNDLISSTRAWVEADSGETVVAAS